MRADIFSRRKLILLSLLGTFSVVAAEVQAPSLEFLEYLGQFETEDGDWFDPLEVEAMAQIAVTTKDPLDSETEESDNGKKVNGRENVVGSDSVSAGGAIDE